tara:strand:- start:473 stop:610 length:138 start_codon:yes stop_codon:yes gene_type:complete
LILKKKNKIIFKKNVDKIKLIDYTYKHRVKEQRMIRNIKKVEIEK